MLPLPPEAMNYGKSRAFVGAYMALVIHVLLAAALGVAIAQLFSVTVLCFTTATVFLLLVAWQKRCTCHGFHFSRSALTVALHPRLWLISLSFYEPAVMMM